MDRAFPQSEILHCDRTETVRAIGDEDERNPDHSTVNLVLLHRGEERHAHEKQPPRQEAVGIEIRSFLELFIDSFELNPTIWN